MRGHFNFVFLLERLFAGAKEEHKASKCPAVDFEICVILEAGFGSAPLLKASASLDHRVLVVKHERDVEVNRFHFNLFFSTGLGVIGSNQNVVRL